MQKAKILSTVIDKSIATNLPLSTENESTGKPAICQSLICTGSPSVLESRKVSEQGIWTPEQDCCHSLRHSLRKSTVKGPRYATVPEKKISLQYYANFVLQQKFIPRHTTKIKALQTYNLNIITLSSFLRKLVAKSP